MSSCKKTFFLFFEGSNACLYLFFPSIGGHVVMVLLNWFSKSRGNLKFKYDVIDVNWVDVDSIISIVDMNYEKEEDIY
jgi:hypothetical protein